MASGSSASGQSARVLQTASIVFIKLVPSGHYQQRILEAAYTIYNTQTCNVSCHRSFVFYHGENHPVHHDTFAADYHMAPTEPNGKSLLDLCANKNIANLTIRDFCTIFSKDLNANFAPQTRHVTFVGDHIWQTRSLLYPFMFSSTPWISFGNPRPNSQGSRRKMIHFVEFRTFMQPFLVTHTQLGVPFELPQYVFRAPHDVHAQVKFFDNLVQDVVKLHEKKYIILRRGMTLEAQMRESASCPVNAITLATQLTATTESRSPSAPQPNTDACTCDPETNGAAGTDDCNQCESERTEIVRRFPCSCGPVSDGGMPCSACMDAEYVEKPVGPECYPNAE
jgi:hypothetical protein